MINDPKEILRVAKDALDKAIETKKQNQELIRSIGPAIIDALKPALDALGKNIKLPEIKVPSPQISVNVPDVNVSHKVEIPEIKVPQAIFNFDASKIKIPDIKMPDEMNTKGWMSIMGYDRKLLNDPIPVQLRDSKGNPIKLFDNLTQILQGGGSHGKSDFFTIKGFSSSAYTDLMNADGRLRVSVETGESAITDAELRASSVPVEQVSGSIWSTYVTGFGSSVGASLLNGDGVAIDPRGRVWNLSQIDEITQKQISGAVDSVWVNGFSASVSVSILNGDGVSLDPRGRTWALTQVDEISTKQISGAIDSVYVTGFSSTIGASIIDSSGVEYSGSNPIPVVIATNFASSTVVVGPVLDGSSDNGSAPVKIGAITRTTNPPISHMDGEITSLSADNLGRMLVRPVQVRALIKTAYASVSSGTEATLITAATGEYLDLIKIMLSNNSTVAVGVDIRAVSGGNILQHYEIPANGVVGESLSIPWPQDATGNSWTIDMPDITGTTVYVSALFSREL